MKYLSLIFILLTTFCSVNAQVPGYYNGTEGVKGEALKDSLNNIIQDHVDFSYSDAKYIMNYADQDPDNPNNIILFYTRRSQSNESWGSGGDFANREHVWAKSHGDFADIRPMDGDAFNLHPADASVNSDRLHYDFDSVPRTSTYIAEADAWVDGPSYKFEPADVSKGRVARTIFYMATRYEGENGELDLKVVDAVNTSALAEHGKLSTLLKWNKQFPPDDFERRRNNRIFEVQRNRNPFIDYPEFADLIWGDATTDPISIGNMVMSPESPLAGSSASISVDILSSISSEQVSAKLFWDITYDGESNSIDMNSSDLNFVGDIDLSDIEEGATVYFKVVAGAGSTSKTLRGDFILPRTHTITPISDVQGTGSASPMSGQVVTIAGIVTANFDGSYYIQSSNDPYNGMCVYDLQRGRIGDSVVVTGKVVEYNNLTELGNITDTYVYPGRAPEPAEVTIDQINESYEGMMVKISDVSFAEGGTMLLYSEGKTLHLSDGSNSIDVYNRFNSRLGGKILPAGKVDVVAVVSQYQDNIQLLIHSMDYIAFVEDNEVPEVTGVTVLSKERIQITFNETLEATSASNKDNYSINGGVNISSAVFSFGRVILQVENLDAKDYVLTINGVTDLQANSMNNASFDFTSSIASALKDVEFASTSLYPNPSNGTLHVRSQKQIQSLRIYNMMGVQIEAIEVDKLSDLTINLEHLASGAYFMQVQHDDKTIEQVRFAIN